MIDHHKSAPPSPPEHARTDVWLRTPGWPARASAPRPTTTVADGFYPDSPAAGGWEAQRRPFYRFPCRPDRARPCEPAPEESPRAEWASVLRSQGWSTYAQGVDRAPSLQSRNLPLLLCLTLRL